MEGNIIDVVGTMFFQNGKLLIVKPRKRPTFQMVGGCIEKGETPIQAFGPFLNQIVFVVEL